MRAERPPTPTPPAWPLLVVLGGVGLGLLIAVLGASTWRLGSLIIGSSLCVGAVARMALPRKEAGLLQVRSRGFDVALLALTGIAIIVLAIAVPPGR